MAKAHLTQDEYNWDSYTQEYSNQVIEMEAAPHQGSDFLVKKWEVKNKQLVLHDNLHVNWKNIYFEIFELKPKSVFECGCGGVYHLKNIKTLFPDIDVFGCDLLQTQIDFGKKKFDIGDDLFSNIKVKDFSKEDAIDDLELYEFVYAHAVLMHISHEKALQFLKNMFIISSKYVYLVEGPQHDYVKLFKEVNKDSSWSVAPGKINNSWLFTRKQI